MKKDLKGTQLEAKRINDIFSYVTSLNSPICNPNCRSIAIANPIMVASAYETLLKLEEEVARLDIDIKQIDVDRVFTRKYANETEVFIANLHDGGTIAYVMQDYKRMIELEDLEMVYPYKEREKRKDELITELEKRQNAQMKLSKVAPQLVQNEEQVIKQLQSELEALRETLDFPTREKLRLKLYSSAKNYIEHLKLMIDNKVLYLEELLEEI